jgi:hypothetical protein
MEKGSQIMADNMPTPSEVDAEKQQGDKSWPKPGDEGFVHPDGTPESVAQLEANKQAQADRDHIGAVAHGAPLATPGPQAGVITAEKVANAAEVGGEDAAPQTWVEANLPTAEDVAAESKPAAAPSRSRASEK